MKLCKDCEKFDAVTGYCGQTARLDPVYGKTIYTLASIERAYNTPTSCGESAKYFLEKYDESLDDLSKIPFGR